MNAGSTGASCCSYARPMETTVEHGHVIRANGIDIHYLERGAGRPLLLLHGGLVSSSLRWAGVPVVVRVPPRDAREPVPRDRA